MTSLRVHLIFKVSLEGEQIFDSFTKIREWKLLIINTLRKVLSKRLARLAISGYNLINYNFHENSRRMI